MRLPASMSFASAGIAACAFATPAVAAPASVSVQHDSFNLVTFL